MTRTLQFTKKWHKPLIVFTSIVLLFAIVGALFLAGFIKINTPSTERYPIRGVDVSEYQGTIDWVAIEKQGMSFAFIKATEGSSYTDAYFLDNWSAIETTTLICGAYHFFSFDSAANTQAENFIKTVEAKPGMFPPVVDIELYGQHKQNYPNIDLVRAELGIMLDLLETHYGVKPIIYATQKSYSLFIRGYFPDYPLWIRDVYFTPNQTADESWAFWQYTDKGLLKGYSGEEKYIDINVFSGSYPELFNLQVGEST